MRMSIAFALSLLFLPSLIMANCGTWLRSFPSSTYILTHSLLFLEGLEWGDDGVITSISKGAEVCLKSRAGDELGLEVVELYKGQGGYRQVLLKLVGIPVFLVRYELQIDNAKIPSNFCKFGQNGCYGQPVEYVFIEKEIDIKKPMVKARPQLLELRYVQYGCGPEQLAIFDFPVSDESEILVKTTVKNVRTTATATLYLIPRDGRMDVGSYMCGGAFYFEDGDWFDVSFDFMDNEWNATPWHRAALEIDLSSIIR